MNCQKITKDICLWLDNYIEQSKCVGFVVGVSGGIDSAVVSTLCAKTQKTTILVSLPIGENSLASERSLLHIHNLCQHYRNVQYHIIDLTETFSTFSKSMPFITKDVPLVMANVQSRMRMTTLYAVAQNNQCLVVGTGNKIEDFEIGFFTKYGDGGVDISPIADLTKSEVFELGTHLEIAPEILSATPTDGLFNDNRSDEQQIGASYPELEWAMNFDGDTSTLSERQKEVMSIYKTRKRQNEHKMKPIPVFQRN